MTSHAPHFPTVYYYTHEACIYYTHIYIYISCHVYDRNPFIYFIRIPYVCTYNKWIHHSYTRLCCYHTLQENTRTRMLYGKLYGMVYLIGRVLASRDVFHPIKSQTHRHTPTYTQSLKQRWFSCKYDTSLHANYIHKHIHILYRTYNKQMSRIHENAIYPESNKYQIL